MRRPPSAAIAPATAPPVRAFGTASCAFRLAARFPAFTTSHPITALRLLTMVIADLPSSARGYPIPAEEGPPRPARRVAPGDRDEGTSCRMRCNGGGNLARG